MNPVVIRVQDQVLGYPCVETFQVLDCIEVLCSITYQHLFDEWTEFLAQPSQPSEVPIVGILDGFFNYMNRLLSDNLYAA